MGRQDAVARQTGSLRDRLPMVTADENSLKNAENATLELVANSPSSFRGSLGTRLRSNFSYTGRLRMDCYCAIHM